MKLSSHPQWLTRGGPRAASGIVLLLLVGLRPVSATAGFEAGFATADITPPAGWRRAGNYTELAGTGVHDPLFAKALVLSQAQTTVAIVGNDLCSVPREPLDYQAWLVDRWTEVIVKAHAAREPVRLSVVVPQQPGLAFNRRFLMKDGSTGWNPGKLNPDIFRPLGPTDPDLPFVLVRAAATDRPLGGLTVFAMHTAIYGGAPFGACYPGHLQTHLRRMLEAPEFVSLFGEGCAGDINHVDVSTREPQDSQSYPPVVGETLAATIHAALPLARPVSEGQLAVRSVTITSPVTPITDAEYAAARRLMENLDRDPAPFLTVVDAWRKMLRHTFWREHGGRLPQEIQAIRLDHDTAIVTLPHEIFVELGMAIKSASPFRTTIVVSLANDLDFYIPTRRAFEEGHYEPTTCPLEPGCGELLVQAAVALLDDLKH